MVTLTKEQESKTAKMIPTTQHIKINRRLQIERRSIDEYPFLCYDNKCIIDNRKGHFLWEIPQKID